LAHGAVSGVSAARVRRQAQEEAVIQQKTETALQTENRELARMLVYLAGAVAVVFGVLYFLIRD
jgi:hypothetical protein